jgi:hypothetical protein
MAIMTIPRLPVGLNQKILQRLLSLGHWIHPVSLRPRSVTVYTALIAGFSNALWHVSPGVSLNLL